MRQLEEFLKPSQEKLFKNIRRWLDKGNMKHFYSKRHYILAKGEAPIMLVAHLDTVHHQAVKYICKTEDGNILMSPQGIGGDDRCGVYALVNAFEMSKVKPWLLFTCDEEIGGRGAEAFCQDYSKEKLPEALDELKCIIEIDRKGKNDAVYYDCDNKDFEDYITGKGFKTQFGSFSDISYIAPELGVAAVNLSSGYYNAHTEHEYINRAEIDAVIGKVVEIVADSARADFQKYKWVSKPKQVSYTGLKHRPAGFRWYGYDDMHPSYSSYDHRIPEDLPWEYEFEYGELLDIYEKSELEKIRKAWGDSILRELYELEYEGVDTRETYLGTLDELDKEELKCAVSQ